MEKAEGYIIAVIASIRKSNPIDVKDLLHNFLDYFDDKEIIDEFNKLEEEISLMKRYASKVDEDLMEEDLVWETIGNCWNMVTNRLGFVTPWTLESTRNDKNLTRFLGSPRTILQVRILIGDLLEPDVDYDSLPTFVYNYALEIAFGVLIAIKDQKNFNAYMEEVYEYTEGEYGNISVDDLLPNFILENKFTANTSFGKISFSTKNVIQGVKIGASWLNVDPHLLIHDVLEGDIPVDF